MLTVGRWSKLLLSSAEGWEWRFQSKTVKSWEKAHFIQAEIRHRTGCTRRKKCTCRSPPKCKRERNPHPGPKHGQWGVVCGGDLEGWAAAMCSYSRSHVGGLRLPPSTACPPTASLSLLTHHFGLAVGTLWGPHEHAGFGLTQEKALTFIRWLQVTKSDQHQHWGVRAVRG